MANETNAAIGWSCERRGCFELFENDPAEVCCPPNTLLCSGHRQREACDATRGIFIPAAEARECLYQVSAFTSSNKDRGGILREIIEDKAEELIAKLPEEEK